MSQQIKNILEAAIMVADEPLSIDRMLSLFAEDGGEPPTRDEIRNALNSLGEDYTERGIELKQVASGYRLQAKSDVAEWVNRLWVERPPRYTRALLETLAIIAYRQPITRGEIEAIRGVSVSTNVIKTLLEREWVKVAGHRDVPGRPAVYASTRQFLDYFNLKTLSELPTLSELRDLDEIATDLFQEKFEVVAGENPKQDQQIADESEEVTSSDEDAESIDEQDISELQSESDSESETEPATGVENGSETEPAQQQDLR